MMRWRWGWWGRGGARGTAGSRPSGFAARCAEAGLCVVSGGAYGVDIAAHRSVLRVKGRTTAVIGSGLNRPYPAEHAETFDRIVAEGSGAVVSELPMFVGPRAEHFPRRNRIISGLSLGVLVIEAARRSRGADHRAGVCRRPRPRECMAVPGRIDSPASAGCHDLIRKGAASLVTSVEDVLEQLGEAGELLKVGLDRHDAAKANGHAASAASAASPSLFEANLTETQRAVVTLLEHGSLARRAGRRVGPRPGPGAGGPDRARNPRHR